MSVAARGLSLKPDKHGHVEAWKGGYRRYDLLKEATVAVVVVTLLTFVLAIAFGSPDDKPLLFQGWAKNAPADFLQVSITELDGTSGIAGYGPPYTTDNSAAQRIGPLCLACIAGARIPVDTAKDFVLGPLSIQGPSNPSLAQALAQYEGASSAQQQAWTSAYEKGVQKVQFSGAQPVLPAGNYGPVATLMTNLLNMARSGGLDGALLTTNRFYQTDYTRALLYLSDSNYFANLAAAQHLGGDQWGMMNETDAYPGQAWLWLYTFWYQVAPFNGSNLGFLSGNYFGANADAFVWALMMVLTLLLVLVPVIPGVRNLPRRLGLYRLIWRDYYRSLERG